MEFRKAQIDDFQSIWEIISYAKNVRKQEGSSQWQDGYPNEQTLRNDITSGNAYVVYQDGLILGYIAIILDGEPAYEAIKGQWLSKGNYAVVHRMAVSAQAKGKGLGLMMLQSAEAFAIKYKMDSLRIDTNYDNLPMLRILEKQGYIYCGEIVFRGSERKAFEKVFNKV